MAKRSSRTAYNHTTGTYTQPLDPLGKQRLLPALIVAGLCVPGLGSLWGRLPVDAMPVRALLILAAGFVVGGLVKAVGRGVSATYGAIAVVASAASMWVGLGRWAVARELAEGADRAAALAAAAPRELLELVRAEMGPPEAIAMVLSLVSAWGISFRRRHQ